MKSATMQYAAVFAKCRAKFATLLKDSDYSALANMKSVGAVAAYLMHNSDYADDLKGVNINEIKRAELEEILYANMMRSYKSLYVFTNGEMREFIGDTMRKYNIDYILHQALSLSNPKPSSEDNEIAALNIAHSEVDMLKVSAAQSLEQLGEALEGTRYHRIYKSTLHDGKLDHASLEVGLYNEYYNHIYNQYAEKRSGPAADSIKKLLHLTIDLINISTILRLTVSFEAKADMIIPYLLSIKGGRDRREYIMLCNMNKEEFLTYLRASKYHKLVPEEAKISTAEFTDNFLNVYYRRLMNSATPSFEHPFAYLSLKELEVKNLIHVIEGIRYGIPPDRIIEKIITHNI
ncbi:MAG: V-type ATPase subunit [Eubacteriales bacterium]|nr:V-type ATPase subunit [Eubacteriales bacterium]MDD4475376.1 V-type ATPase subunit [Eubacteriales bacterium]